MKSLLVSAAVVCLAACNTAQGVKTGEALQKGGEAVEHALQKSGEVVGGAIKKGGEAVQKVVD